MYETRILLLAILFTATYAFVEVDASAQTRRQPTEMSPAQATERLKRSGVLEYYPRFVPARFSLVSVQFAFAGKGEWPYHDYQLEFCDEARLCFTISTASGGVGDGPDGERLLRGRSKAFGPFFIDVSEREDPDNGEAHTYYVSSWLSDEPARNEKTMGDRSAHRVFQFSGYGVTDKEAVAIVESLARRP